MRLDVASATCQVFGFGYQSAVALTDDESILLLGVGAGFVSVDADPQSATLGAVVDVWPSARPAPQFNFMWPPLISDSQSGVIPGSTTWYVSDALGSIDPTGGKPISPR